MSEKQALSGLERAAQWVEKRRDDYDAEHGTTDPETGTREYPGDGNDYVYELTEIAEGIRALAAASAPPGEPAPALPQAPAEHNGGRTGWAPGLLQDDSKGLSKWLASKPDAREHVRDVVAPAPPAAPVLPTVSLPASVIDAVMAPLNLPRPGSVSLQDLHDFANLLKVEILARLPATPQPELSPASVPKDQKPLLTLTGHQIAELAKFAGDDAETEISIQHRKAFICSEGEEMPAGMYAWATEYPEEGCIPVERFPDCSMVPESCPRNEGHGCECSIAASNNTTSSAAPAQEKPHG